MEEPQFKIQDYNIEVIQLDLRSSLFLIELQTTLGIKFNKFKHSQSLIKLPTPTTQSPMVQNKNYSVQRSTTHPVEVQHVQHVQVQQPQPVRVSADPQFQTRVSGPAHRVEVDHEEKKEGGISPSAACWGLLGLLGLIGLILGILFGVGVIGRQDTVIEKIGTNNGTAINTNTNVNVNTNTNTNSKTNTNVNVNTNTNTNGGISSSSSTTTNGGATGTNTNTNTNTNGGTSSTTTTTNGSTTTNNNGSTTTSTTTTTTANGSTTTTTTGKHQLRPVHSAAKH